MLELRYQDFFWFLEGVSPLIRKSSSFAHFWRGVPGIKGSFALKEVEYHEFSHLGIQVDDCDLNKGLGLTVKCYQRMTNFLWQEKNWLWCFQEYSAENESMVLRRLTVSGVRVTNGYGSCVVGSSCWLCAGSNSQCLSRSTKQSHLDPVSPGF